MQRVFRGDIVQRLFMTIVEKGAMRDRLTVLILCAGDGERWGNHLGRPKQLLEIGGETLLGRIHRQLASHRIDDAIVVGRDPLLRQGNWIVFEPESFRWTVETLLSTQELWRGSVVVLLGDVFYSDAAMRKILNSKKDLSVFGRKGANTFTNTKWGELFAIRFGSHSYSNVVHHIMKSMDHAESGGRGKIWEFYYSAVGFDLNQSKTVTESRVFVSINDYTDDIDSPDDYSQLEPVISRLLEANYSKTIQANLMSWYRSLKVQYWQWQKINQHRAKLLLKSSIVQSSPTNPNKTVKDKRTRVNVTSL